MSMSTAAPVLNEAQAIKARNASATRAFCDALQLGVVPPKNLQFLTIALTEVVTNEITRNPDLGEKIRVLYEGLIPVPKARSPRRTGVSAQGENSSSTRRGNTKPSPKDPPDLEYLARTYSREQLPVQLKKYAIAALKDAVALVQEQHPENPPASLKSKDALVNYILSYGI